MKALRALLLLCLVGLSFPAWPDAAIVGGVPTAVNDGATYAAGAGSNRVVVIGIAREASGTGVTPNISTLTWGSLSVAGGTIVQAATIAQGSGNRIRASIYYVLEANIPAGAETLAATWSTTMAGTTNTFTVYTLSGVDQADVVDTVVQTTTSSDPWGASFTVANGTVQVLDAAVNDNNASTPDGAWTEFRDANDGAGTSRRVSHYKTTATGGSITWALDFAGGNTGAVAIASFNPSTASPPSFSVGPTISAQDDNDYTFSYTPSASATFYGVACAKDSTAPTVAQVKAGDCTGDVDAIAAVNEAVTGADTTVLSIGGTPRPIHDLYGALSNGDGDSSLATLADEMLDPPAGMQFITLASIGAGSPCASFNTATNPDLAAGDILRAPTTTSPGSYALTISTACQFSYSGDSSRQLALNILAYDTSVGAYHADDIDFVANNQTPVPPEPNSITYRWTSGVAIDTVDFNANPPCTDAEGDDITVAEVSGLADGLTLSGNEITGTPSTPGVTTLVLSCTDIYGASVDWQ